MDMGDKGSTWDIEVRHCSDSTSGSEAVLVFEAFVTTGTVAMA